MAVASPGSVRASTALVLGTVVNGVAIYAVAALGTRVYGAAGFAPVSVLWTFWAVAAAVLTFPLQHWVIHRVATDGHEGGVRAALPRVAVVAIALAAVLGSVAWMGRERLFGDERLVWPALVAALTVGAAANGYLRGVLAGRRRFVAAASAIATENLVRLLGGAIVVVAGGPVIAYGAVLAMGALVGLLWPDAFRLRGPPLTRPGVAGFIGGLAGGTVLAQVALTAGPAVLSAMGGGPAEVTALFATMALFRAPYLVGLGQTAQLTAPLTSMVDREGPRGVRSVVRWTAIASLTGAMVVGGAAFFAGGTLVDLVFGPGTAPEAPIVALVAAGSTLAVGTLVLTIISVARGTTGTVAWCWLGALAAAVITVALAGGTEVWRVALGFLVAQVVASAAMTASHAVTWRGQREAPTSRTAGRSGREATRLPGSDR